jgi:rhodanese-related sulfurtransferase
MHRLHLLFAPLLLTLALVAPGPARGAGPWDNLPEAKKSTLKLYLHPKEAYAIMSGPEAKKSLFVDVRTLEEVIFVGMATLVDFHIPYLEMPESPEIDPVKNTLWMEPNADFVDMVEDRLGSKGLGKNDRIILICRSGERSAQAANTLAQEGFRNVWTVVEGFEGDLDPQGHRNLNGWKNDGLPWSYDLVLDKLTTF